MHRGRLHDQYVREFAFYLIGSGRRVAWEVGVPYGRVDVVHLGDDGDWLEIFEIKSSSSLSPRAVSQLETYGENAPGNPRLTLVIPPDVSAVKLLPALDVGTVAVARFPFTGLDQEWPDGPGEWVDLPYIHPAHRTRFAA